MDNLIYGLCKGRMVRMGEPKGRPWTEDNGVEHSAEERLNFVIVCEYGDWSGFRTLAECKAQFPELESSAKRADRPDGWYRVVERL